MEVMRACLMAMNELRPDPEWEPPIGELYLRVQWAPWSSKIQFCYQDSTNHHFSLAHIQNWRGEPQFYGFVDLTRGDIDLFPAAPVVRRLATEADIEALVRLWVADKAPGSCRCTLLEWAKIALTYPKLSDESKRLIMHFQLV